MRDMLSNRSLISEGFSFWRKCVKTILAIVAIAIFCAIAGLYIYAFGLIFMAVCYWLTDSKQEKILKNIAEKWAPMD